MDYCNICSIFVKVSTSYLFFLTLLCSSSVHSSQMTLLGVAILHTKRIHPDLHPDLLQISMGFTVRYTRERLYAIRRSTLVNRKPTEAVLSNLNHLNILRYRGSRAGVNKPRKIIVLNQNQSINMEQNRFESPAERVRAPSIEQAALPP